MFFNFVSENSDDEYSYSDNVDDSHELELDDLNHSSDSDE